MHAGAFPGELDLFAELLCQRMEESLVAFGIDLPLFRKCRSKVPSVNDSVNAS